MVRGVVGTSERAQRGAGELPLARVEPALQQQDHGAAGGLERFGQIRARGGLGRLGPLEHHMARHDHDGTLGVPGAEYRTAAPMSEM